MTEREEKKKIQNEVKDKNKHSLWQGMKPLVPDTISFDETGINTSKTIPININKNQIDYSSVIKLNEKVFYHIKEIYEKNKDPFTLYLLIDSARSLARKQPTIEKTEEVYTEVIKIIDEMLKEQPNNLYFINLKLSIYYELAEMYYNAYNYINNVPISQSDFNKESKPTLWQRMKKPLAAGLLGASLLLHPVKNVDAVGFAKARDPPYYAAKVIEKKYNTGWKLLLKVAKEQRGENKIDDSLEIKLNESAINYFKKKYEETKDIDALYLWVYSIYSLAAYHQTFEETEKTCLEAIKIIDERLKEKHDFDFIDLKLMIYYNLADMYYGGHIKDPDYVSWGHVDFSKLDFYKQKSIEYCNKHNEYLKEVKKIWNEVDKYIFKDLNYTAKDVTLVKEDFMNDFIRKEKELESIQSKLKE
ncbi:MAG: hypothetical protein QXE90_03195 [Candidatus Micrarchaeia archaeon]